MSCKPHSVAKEKKVAFTLDYSLLSVQRASLGAQMVKNPPAVQETQVRSLGPEDPQKGMATHSSILAWRIPRADFLHGL